MTTMERRAQEACQRIEANGSMDFAVYWARSSTWGLCPRIEWHGKKAAHASGCGYDKLSAVLADFLHPLVPEVGGLGGAGVGSVIRRMAAHGWKLEHVYEGSTEDGFTITKNP